MVRAGCEIRAQQNFRGIEHVSESYKGSEGELFDRLVAEALAQPFSGWNWSQMAERWREAPTSWDYRQKVRAALAGANAMLDMGTGGGEVLASLAPLPSRTVATEGYAPNVPVARARLEPMGVQLVDAECEAELPFDDASFDLVINRHSGYRGSEVYRVLRPGGRFLTQQVGGRNIIELNELLQDRVEFEYAPWTLDCAIRELEEAGFTVVERYDESPETVVADIGAVVFYLRIISWQIADFSVERYEEKLRRLHRQMRQSGPLVIHSHRFYIAAQK
jgi:SAM-dependent methyltransferase